MKKIIFIFSVSILMFKVQAGLDALRNELSSLGNMISELRLKVSDLEKQNTQLADENTKLANMNEALVNQKQTGTTPATVDNERVAQLEKELETLKGINRDLLSKLPKPGQDPIQQKNTELESQLKNREVQLAKTEEKHQRATQMIGDLKKKHDAELKQKDIEIDTLRDIANTKSDKKAMTALEAEIMELKEQIQRLRALLDEKLVKDGVGAVKIAEIKNVLAEVNKKSAEIIQLKADLAEQTAEARECKIKLLKASLPSKE